MPQIRYIDMGCWPYHVAFTPDPAEFDREMRRLKIKDQRALNHRADATTHFLVHDGHSPIAIIVLPYPKSRVFKEQYAAMLAHEAVHVIQDMRDQLGELGCEAEAYIAQQIVQEGLQQAWKTGRSKRVRPAAD